MQEDDEFVVQLLYLFLQLLRHRELANRLMGADSALGAYVIDLMHDKNPAIREMCDNALVIIGVRYWQLYSTAVSYNDHWPTPTFFLSRSIPKNGLDA